MDNDNEMQFNQNMACVFISQIPNMKIESYGVIGHGNSTEILDSITMNINHEISKSFDEISISFIFFCNNSGLTEANNFISFMQQRYNIYLTKIMRI